MENENTVAKNLGEEESKDEVLVTASSVLNHSSPKIKSFSGDDPNKEDILEWMERFEAAAENLKDAAKLKKLRIFLTGPAADWYFVNVQDRQPVLSYSEVVTKMKDHFQSSSDPIALRQQLVSIKQDPSKPVQNFITAVQRICKRINPAMAEDEKVNHVLNGLEPNIQHAMFSLNPTTVEELIKLAKQYERGSRVQVSAPTKTFLGKNQAPENQDLRTLVTDMARMMNDGHQQQWRNQRQPYRGHNQQQRGGHQSRYERYQSDHRQGNNWQPRQQASDNNQAVRETAPVQATDSKGAFVPRTNTGRIRCYACGGDHPVRFCPNNNQTGQTHTNVLVKDETALLLLALNEMVLHQVDVNGEKATAMVDCGSSVTFVTKKLVDRVGLRMRRCDQARMFAVNGTEVQPFGIVDVLITINDGTEEVAVMMSVYVLQEFTNDVLLGNDFSGTAGLIVDIRAKTIKLKKPETEMKIKCENEDDVLMTASGISVEPKETKNVIVMTRRNNLENKTAWVYTNGTCADLKVSDTVCQVTNCFATVQVYNESNEVVVIDRNITIANFVVLSEPKHVTPSFVYMVGTRRTELYPVRELQGPAQDVPGRTQQQQPAWYEHQYQNFPLSNPTYHTYTAVSDQTVQSPISWHNNALYVPPTSNVTSVEEDEVHLAEESTAVPSPTEAKFVYHSLSQGTMASAAGYVLIVLLISNWLTVVLADGSKPRNTQSSTVGSTEKALIIFMALITFCARRVWSKFENTSGEKRRYISNVTRKKPELVRSVPTIVSNEVDTFEEMEFYEGTVLYSPFYLLYGREPLTPLEVVLDVPTLGIKSPKSYCDIIHRHLEHVRAVARNNLTLSNIQVAARYNDKHRPVSYEVEDRVLIYFPTRKKGLAEKLLHRWRGPYKITKRLSPIVYEVQLVRGRNKKLDTVHISRMKPFYDRSELVDIVDTTDSDETDVQVEIRRSVARDVQHETREKDAPEVPTSESSSDSATIINSANETTVDETIRPEAEAKTGAQSDSSEPSAACEAEQQHTGSDKPGTTQKEPEVRRSTRERKPPSRLNISNLKGKTFLNCVLLIQPILGYFVPAPPVLWQPSKVPVINGKEDILLYLKYEEPCEIFMKSAMPETFRRNFKSWCERMFASDVMTPLETFCQNTDVHEVHSTKTLIRHKRLEPVTTTVVIGALITLGVSAYSYFSSMSTSKKIEDVNRKIEDLMDKFNQLTRNEIEISKMLSQVENKLEKTILSLKDSGQSGNWRIAKTNDASLTVGIMVQSKTTLWRIGRAWKTGTIHEELLSFFNVTLPCSPSCPIQRSYTKLCTLDRSRQLIKLHFSIDTLDQSISVLRASPFKLLNFENGTVCKKVYTGPKYVLMNSEKNCLTPVGTERDEVGQMIISSRARNCVQQQPGTMVQPYWNNLQCVEYAKRDMIDDIQVVITELHVYVYCPHQNVTVYGHTRRCPEHVFTVPSSVSFIAGSYKYEAKSVAIKATIDFVPELSHHVNFLMMPLVEEIALEPLNHFRTYSFEHLNKFDKRSTLYFSSLFILVVVLPLLYVVRTWLKLSNGQNQEEKPEEENELELQTLPKVSRHQQTN
ncbi:hypothetical protein HDE_01055 [Halotydeus destructor]|nr:hypothetical protein HDE_01055 [Halotydeus destructor]